MNRVLVVDDKEDNLCYLQSLLEAKGWQVITAHHGAEALLKARQEPPDLIISDLLMPVMDGYTLLRHWKSDSLLKAIPFIVYTATYTEPSDEKLALNLGADAFILKPAEPTPFILRLQEVLASRTTAKRPAGPVPVEDTPELLEHYSQTLIRKLEEKTLQLEEANLALQKDLAERHKVEAILRASQASMAAAQQIAHFGSWELDLDVSGTAETYSQALRWSDEAYRIAGFEPGSIEVTSRLFFGLVPEADHEKIHAAMRQAIDQRSSYSVIHRLIRPSGEERIIHETARPFCDEQTGLPIKMIGTAHDVTDQHRAAEAQARSEREQRELALQLELESARLVTAQTVAKMGSWETDLLTWEVIWSAQTHCIFGTDPRTFLPSHQRFLEFVHPDDRDQVDRAFTQSFSLHDAQEVQHRIVMPDGREKHVIERWQVFPDAGGRPRRAVGTVQDITERRQAEAELQRTHNLLQSVADGIPDAVFVKDLEGRYLLFNQGAAHLVGQSVAEVLGKNDVSLFGQEGARVIANNDRRVLETGAIHTEEEVLTAAGVTRTYLATKAPYRDAQGKIIGVIGISRDITERKQNEQKLYEHATLLERARDAIVVRDLDHRILFWNRGAERIYGWTAEEVLGRSIKELLYQDPMPFIVATASVIENGEWIGEIDQFDRDGKAVTIEGRWTLLRDDTGRPKSILAINTDVTERKQLEQQFLRAQRMDSIGTLAGGIAHDLNNVLLPILMSVEVLRLQETDERRLGILATIETSAKRGAAMVRQVLSFARGVESQKEEISARLLLKEIEKIVNETFLKTISIRCQIADDLWTVSGDPTQLHQVLLNLCVNARDAMPSGGVLSLSARNMMVDGSYASMNIGARPGPYVILEVEDNGMGMPTAVVERIFEPFFTTKEIGKGTGLGLSTTLAIVKSHGGFVRVESDVGVGTKFQVFIPANPNAVITTDEPGTHELPQGKGELVLVVDDEAIVLEITRHTLESFGYRVLLATDGAEAVSLFAAHEKDISIVLTDMMMPVMDGPSTAQVLRRINPAVKIVGASGMNVSGMVAKASAAGVRHFLPKPYTAETLLVKLHQVLDEESA